MNLRHGSPEDVGMSSERLQKVTEAMRDWSAREGQQGAVWLAARKGVIVTHEAVGRLRPAPDSPAMALDSLFSIYSITKPITAAAAIILVEEGRLGLNLPVSFYVPELSGEGKDAITVLHLLTHTSGMRDQEVNEHATKVDENVALPEPEPMQHPVIAKYLALRWDAPLWKPPGSEMAYGEYGYNLLGEVIRRVCGQSLTRFASERIFEPLGMKDTHYGVQRAKLERQVEYPWPNGKTWL